MHISEGVLSAPVLVTGALLTAGGTAIGLKKLDFEKIAQAGILSSAFFVASLIHVNIGPSSTHLILNGILGLILGWAAFPVILVALTLQSLFFQFGGITSLGVNTFNMAFPSVLCFYLFRYVIVHKKSMTTIAAFACGFLSVFGVAVLLGGSLYLTEQNFWEISSFIVMINFPVMIIEGIITAFCVRFIQKVSPEMFQL